MVQNLVKTIVMERSSLSPTVIQVGIIKLVRLEDHRFIVLDNICSHMMTGSISVDVKCLL